MSASVLPDRASFLLLKGIKKTHVQRHYLVTQSNGQASVWEGCARGYHKADLHSNRHHGPQTLYSFWGYRYRSHQPFYLPLLASLIFCCKLYSISEFDIIFHVFVFTKVAQIYREKRKRTFTATLKEKLCLVNQVEINWDDRIAVIFHLRLCSVGDGRKKKRVEETLLSAMCSNGVNPTKLCQFVGTYALHRWYLGMLVVTLVTTGKVGDPSTSVMQWEYSLSTIPGSEISTLHFTACCPLRTLPAAEPPRVHIYSKHTQTHAFMFLHTMVKQD